MREIKFRAQRVDSDEFEYGYIVRYGCVGKEKFFIVPTYASNLYSMEIDKNTIGQYTGLHDKNGVEIYEGDIVRFINNINEVYEEKVGLCVYELDECNFCLQYKVRNNTEICIYKSIPFSTRTIYLISNETYKNDVRYEVIGNIYENPELLKSEVTHERDY